MILHAVYPGTSGATAVALDIYSQSLKNKNNKSCLVFFGNTKISNSINRFLKRKKIFFFKIIYNFFILGNINFLILLFKVKPKKILMHNYLILPIIFYKFFYNVDLYTVVHTNLEIIQNKIKKNIFFRIIIYLILRYSKKIIIVNKLNKKVTILKRYTKKVHVIPNCVDHNFFKRKKIFDKKKIILGTAGRLVQNNKTDMLVDIISQLKNKYKIINIKLYIAGNGTELLNLKKKVKQNKLSKNIIFNGNLDKFKMKKWYDKINVYLHISEKEFMSTSILQAMLYKLPIIASDLFENNFILDASRTKNTLVKNQITNISDEILKMFKKKINLVEENRNYVKKFNNIDLICNKYLKILK